jgi:hypothetical protein
MVAAKSVPQNHLADPFEAVLNPPQGETSAQRDARLLAEQLAKRVSDAIDEQLRAERAELKKSRPDVRILLLGQSESGKSTTLKRTRLIVLLFISQLGRGPVLMSAYTRSRLSTSICSCHSSRAHSYCRIPAPSHTCCVPGRTNSMALCYLYQSYPFCSKVRSFVMPTPVRRRLIAS